jgi:uncharacterized protein (TIGR03492 family)
VHVCFLSNGFGEDRSAAIVAARLAADQPGVQVGGAPLLSDGAEYRVRGVPVLTAGWMPWSGGFSTLSLGTWLRDLPFLAHVARFRRELASRRRDIDAVVVVGDVFLLLLARAALPPRPVFIALAKSNYHQPHSAVECAILRRAPRVVLTRDELTRLALADRHIRARFLGNLLMDGFVAAPPPEGPRPTVLLLPGRRREAPSNLARMLEVVGRIDSPARWVCALAPSVSIEAVAERSRASGWRLEGMRLVYRDMVVDLVQGAFEAAVAGADVALGVAGTANEQAAGLGCPVVSFPGAGPQACAKRLRQQARLLGDGAIFVHEGADAVAATLSRLLLDSAERKARGRAGRARMGPPGASAVAGFLAGEFGLRPGGLSS